MATEVSICNRALQSIGTRTSIAALTESSTEARNCNLIYADTRDEILGMAFWNFAKKTGYLGLLKSAPGTPSNTLTTGNSGLWIADYPPPPWLYEYAYPADCLQMRSIVQQMPNYYVGVPLTSNGNGNAYPYFVGPGAMFEVALDTVEGQQQNVVLTNQYQAIGIYTAQVTSTGLFSADFTEALVQALAAKLALALTGQVALANSKFQQANAVIRQARVSDGNEGLTIIDPVPDWIAAREDGFGAGAYLGYNAPYGMLYGTVA